MCGKTHHAKELAQMLGCVTIVEGDNERATPRAWDMVKTPILILTTDHTLLPDYMKKNASVRLFENLKPRLDRGLTYPIVNRFEEEANEPAK